MDTSSCSKATYATSISNPRAEILIQSAVPRFHNTISSGSLWVFADDWWENISVQFCYFNIPCPKWYQWCYWNALRTYSGNAIVEEWPHSLWHGPHKLKPRCWGDAWVRNSLYFTFLFFPTSRKAVSLCISPLVFICGCWTWRGHGLLDSRTWVYW